MASSDNNNNNNKMTSPIEYQVEEEGLEEMPTEAAVGERSSSRTAAYPEKDETLTMKSLEAAVADSALEKGGTGEEEASCSSSGGQGGSGSGGGYSADYSSSDSSSAGSKHAPNTDNPTKASPETSATGVHSCNDDILATREETSNNPSNGVSLANKAIELNGANQNDQQAGKANPSASSTTPFAGVDLNNYSMWSSIDQYQPPLTHTGTLPQLNGIRVHNPMDPRIDIDTVRHIQESNIRRDSTTYCDKAAVAAASGNTVSADPQNNSASMQLPVGDRMDAETVPEFDHYLHLLEAVRPFFSAYERFPKVSAVPSQPSVKKANRGSGSDETQVISSEGFTSFFTTTNSNSTGSETDAKLQQQGDQDSQKGGLAPPTAKAQGSSKPNCSGTNTRIPRPQDGEHNSASVAAATMNSAPRTSRPWARTAEHRESAEESDSSSMVVLARVKRKHLKRRAESKKNSSTDSNTSSSEKKVRIAEGRPRETRSSIESPNDEDELHKTAPRDASSDPAVALEAAGQAVRAARESSSSSEEQMNEIHAQQGQMNLQQENAVQGGPAVGLHHYPMPPRVISESSERNGSSTSRTMTTTTSGSGTGSGTGSGNGSGTGSNNGSSGSGNEGKGSGSDQLKGDNSGPDMNSNSDECNHRAKSDLRDNEHLRATTLNPFAAKSVADASQTESKTAATNSASQELESKPSELEAREKKLLDKKRKRMNMRREYEEHVKEQLASSESSSGDEFLRPGKPITLDDVLCFTKTARLVVQSRPPFLVVHANAAFTTLSGIDSHAAVGKPVSSLMSIPQKTYRPTDPGGGEAEAAAGEAMSSVSSNSSSMGEPRQSWQRQEQNVGQMRNVGRAQVTSTRVADTCLERLVAACGYGCFHVVNVAAAKHQILGRNVTVIHQGHHLQHGNPGVGSHIRNNRDDQGSHGSTLQSSDCSQFRQHVICRMGVSPVVSVPRAMDYAVVTDSGPHHHHHHHVHHSNPVGLNHHLSSCNKEVAATHLAPSKRRGNFKHHTNDDDNMSSQRCYHRHAMVQKDAMRRNFSAQRNAITHYAIQLEPVDGSPLRHCWAGDRGEDQSASTSTTLEARIYGLTKAELKRRRLADNGGDAAAGVAVAEIDIAAAVQQQLEHHQESNGGEDDMDLESQGTPPVAACG